MQDKGCTFSNFSKTKIKNVDTSLFNSMHFTKNNDVSFKKCNTPFAFLRLEKRLWVNGPVVDSYFKMQVISGGLSRAADITNQLTGLHSDAINDTGCMGCHMAVDVDSLSVNCDFQADSIRRTSIARCHHLAKK